MQRRQFIKNVSTASIIACTDCLIGCNKTTTSEQNNNPSNQFIIDLNSQLLSIHDVVVENNIRVVRIAGGNLLTSFTAVDQYCSHAAGNLSWIANQNLFKCPVHGSEFTPDGTVIAGSGPAGKNLTKFNMSINGSVLTVKS